MKNIIVCILLLGFTIHGGFAQDNTGLKGTTSLGISLATGIFNPRDVNNYMREKYSAYFFEYGFPEIIMNVNTDASFGYFLTNNLRIQFLAGLGWAPKSISLDDGSSDSYNFMRYSVGAIPDLHIPLRRNSCFIGIGPVLSHLSFESYSGNSLGFKTIAGYTLDAGRYLLDIYLGYDYITTVSDQLYSNRTLELNYSGVNFGLNYSFPIHKP